MDQAQAREASGRYPKGVSGNLAGRPSVAQRKAAIVAKAHELGEAVGGFSRLSPIEQQQLLTASEMILFRPRSRNDRLRSHNLASRILRDLQLGHRHKPASRRSELGEYLKGRVSA
jgi:hypothetical protein